MHNNITMDQFLGVFPSQAPVLTPPHSAGLSPQADLVEPSTSVFESDSDSDVPVIYTDPSTPEQVDPQGISHVAEPMQATAEHLSLADEPAQESSSPPAAQGIGEQNWALESPNLHSWSMQSSIDVIDGGILYNLEPSA